MLPEAELRRVLVTLPRTVLHGPWSRTIAFNLLHRPPVDVSPAGMPLPLWPGGPARLGARFTPPGGCDSIYLASDVNTAVAEIQGLLQPSTGPIILSDLRPWTLITIDGVLTGLVDLTNAGVQASLGTSLQELTGHWWYSSPDELAPTQILGRAAYDTGTITGLLYISSKNPAGRCIAVFADRLVQGGSSFLEVVDPTGHLQQRLPPEAP